MKHKLPILLVICMLLQLGGVHAAEKEERLLLMSDDLAWLIDEMCIRDRHLSQTQLAELVGVSRNTISSIETGQFNPTAKLALILCIALEQKFEDLFYFDEA